MSRKRTQGAMHTFGETDRGCARRVDEGTRQGGFQNLVPQRARRSAELRLRPVSSSQTHRRGAEELFLLVAKTPVATCTSTYGSYGTASGRSRPCAHCPLVGP